MYTLQDFLNDNPIQGLKVLTEVPNAFQIAIGSISVQELPIDDFVQKNEMILSTAIGCLDSRDAFQQFLYEIKQSEAAAAVFSFKDRDYQIDSAILRYAEEIQLPLLSIPWEVRFADVLYFVLQKINRKSLEVYKLIQDKLFHAYFTQKTMEDAVKIIYSYLKVPVDIVGKDGRRCSAYPPWALEGAYETAEIRINTFLWGYIHVYQGGDAAAPPLEKALIEKYMALPLSLWFNQENIEDMTALKLKNDFVWNLANHNYTSFEEMMRQGNRLGFHLYNPYMCVAFRVFSSDAGCTLDEYSPQAAALVSKIEELLIQERQRQDLNVIFADRGLLFIAYIEIGGFSSEKTIEAFISSVDWRFSQLYASYQIYWGMSEISREQTGCFEKRFQNAMLALQYCINAKGKKYVFSYRDTQFHQVVSAMSTLEEIKRYASETLAPLTKHDAESSASLTATLMEFIKNNYNASETARRLHLNRQSLLYRLKKIEQLSGMSLNSHRDLFLLEIYTRAFSDD